MPLTLPTHSPLQSQNTTLLAPFGDMQSFFSDPFGFQNQIISRASAFPVDVKETGDRIVVNADLPGVAKENVRVSGVVATKRYREVMRISPRSL